MFTDHFMRFEFPLFTFSQMKPAAVFPQFKKYMRELSSQSSIHELMEFLHSFVGWCGDHGQAASPMSEYSRLSIAPEYSARVQHLSTAA